MREARRLCTGIERLAYADSPVREAHPGDTCQGIEPGQCLYVGNDMLNDVWTASQSGMRTCLFAGDLRSLRRREDDPRCMGLKADAVVTALDQLDGLLDAAAARA